MPKTKEFISESESDSDSDVPVSSKKRKVEEKKKKEKKEEKKKEEKKDSKSKSSSSGDGDEVKIELSKMRFVSVQEFRGKKLISIREYYEKDGDMLPGRKGISLTIDQWEKLKDSMDEIDAALD